MTEHGSNPDEPIRVPGTDRLFRRGLILVPLLTNLAMVMMAISSINVALPSIELDVGASESDLQWLLSGYALAFGIVLVACGRIGDVFGRSTSFVVGWGCTPGIAGLCVRTRTGPAERHAAGAGHRCRVSSPQVNGMILQYFSDADAPGRSPCSGWWSRRRSPSRRR